MEGQWHRVWSDQTRINAHRKVQKVRRGNLIQEGVERLLGGNESDLKRSLDSSAPDQPAKRVADLDIDRGQSFGWGADTNHMTQLGYQPAFSKNAAANIAATPARGKRFYDQMFKSPTPTLAADKKRALLRKGIPGTQNLYNNEYTGYNGYAQESDPYNYTSGYGPFGGGGF